MGSEFAKEFPKIAGRLGIEGLECADPYVERLLEGFAFLAARVQLRIDDEFPRFTHHLLEMVYPHYLAPTPSTAIVRFQPDLTEGTLNNGFVVPRQSALRSLVGAGEQTPCYFRTAHDVTLWPLEIAEARYSTYVGDLPKVNLTGSGSVKAALRIRLRASAGLTFDKLALDSLCVYLCGSGEIAMQIYERVFANTLSVVVRPADTALDWHDVVDKSQIRRVGFDDDHALLPYGPRSFSGYRLLHEYFTLPERFNFVEFGGLGPAVRRCTGSELDVILLLDRNEPFLEKLIDASQFALFCTPVINLFKKNADRIHLTERFVEHHVVADKSRPMDYEIYEVKSVTGYGTSADRIQDFFPFYAANDFTGAKQAYYTVQRKPRILSSKQIRDRDRPSYLGSEVFISVVDASNAPYRTDLRQLGIETYCTNRHLPLRMPLGRETTDFTLETSAPVKAVRCVAGPTSPKPSYAQGETAWRLISHLSLNYLSLADNDEKEGAAALREMLMLYGEPSEASVRKQIEGVSAIKSDPVVRKLPVAGPLAFGRGLEVKLTFNEAAFAGSGVFLLGAVLEEFFTRYVSINSFVETVIATSDRGEIMRWPLRLGTRQRL